MLLTVALTTRTNKGYSFGVFVILAAIFMAVFAKTLGIDFENYEYAVIYINEYRELPLGWPTTEKLFYGLVQVVADSGLTARSLSVINGVLLIASIYAAPKIIRGLYTNTIISWYLTLSIFNGIRLGFAVAIVAFILMLFFRYKKRINQLLLIIVSVLTHSSLIFPMLLLFAVKRNIFLITSIYIFVISLLLIFDPFLFFDFLFTKLMNYFSAGESFTKYGATVLFFAECLMLIGWKHLLSVKIMITFFVTISICLLISFFSYFGLRLLGLVPIAFYFYVMDIIVQQTKTKSDIHIPVLAQLSFLLITLINIKNILFNDDMQYLFS
jgi:hypothetical protein